MYYNSAWYFFKILYTGTVFKEMNMFRTYIWLCVKNFLKSFECFYIEFDQLSKQVKTTL